MLITRGTRGDIQPFTALAKGLAERLGWKVTFCTELRYKESLQKAFANLERGYVQFRPSGGDTTKKIESTVSKMAMTSKSALMQVRLLDSSPQPPEMCTMTPQTKGDTNYRISFQSSWLEAQHLRHHFPDGLAAAAHAPFLKKHNEPPLL